MWLVTSCSCPTGKPPHVTGHIMQLSNRQTASSDWSHHGTVQQASHLMWLVTTWNCPIYTQRTKTTQLHGMLAYMKHNLRLFKKKLSKIIYSKQCMPTVMFLCVSCTCNDFTSKCFSICHSCSELCFQCRQFSAPVKCPEKTLEGERARRMLFIPWLSASTHAVLALMRMNALGPQMEVSDSRIYTGKFPSHPCCVTNDELRESHWPNLWHTLQESQWKELLPFGQD